MIKKLSIEEFNRIKLKLYELMNQVDTNTSQEEDERIFEQYQDVLKDLATYDLSDIPFEAWEDVPILADYYHPIDFSKTHANIDFKLVECDGFVNFKGCNIRNLSFNRLLNPYDYDEKTIRENDGLFLSDLFSEEFKYDYHSKLINVDELLKLNDEQIEELKSKDYLKSFRYGIDSLFKYIDLDKAIAYYRINREEAHAVSEIIKFIEFEYRRGKADNFLDSLRTKDISELKDACFNYVRDEILAKSNYIPDKMPQLFKDESPEFYPKEIDLPEEVKERYKNRELTIKDVLDNKEAFKGISIDRFMASSIFVDRFILSNYGPGKFQEMLYKYPDFFMHLEEFDNLFEFTEFYFISSGDLERDLRNAVKNYISTNFQNVLAHGEENYNQLDWAQDFNFTYLYQVRDVRDLLSLDENTIVMDSKQAGCINNLGIENIKKLESELHFFSHKFSNYGPGMHMLELFGDYFARDDWDNKDDFKRGLLPYDEFKEVFARALDIMRKKRFFLDYPDYDWIKGEFREEHPEIFMDENAPGVLKHAYYTGRLSVIKPEYIPFLLDKDLSSALNISIKLRTIKSENNHEVLNDFIKEYSSRYGNEKLLRLLAKYGKDTIADIIVSNFNNEIDSEEEIEREFRRAIVRKINSFYFVYAELESVPEFVEEYPELFLDLSSLTSIPEEERERLTVEFYYRTLKYEDIKKYPELITILKDKNLVIAFQKTLSSQYSSLPLYMGLKIPKANRNVFVPDLDLIEIIGNENFLRLCSSYGEFMIGMTDELKEVLPKIEAGMSFEELDNIIRNNLTDKALSGRLEYSDVNTPDFLREEHPELFLSDDAPDELKDHFYNYGNNYPMTFDFLAEHKDWLPFLEGKAIKVSILRNWNRRDERIKFFELFGDEKAIKLGINRAETVEHMILYGQVDLMKAWYDKTGGKFIPDFVVMENFDLEDADKFLASGSNWSMLMRNWDFARRSESREAMLKLAYSFGAFDHDQRGFKKLQDLLCNLPRRIDASQQYMFDTFDNQIDMYSGRLGFHHYKSRITSDGETIRVPTKEMSDEEKQEALDKMIEFAKSKSYIDLMDTETMVKFLESIKKEKPNIDCFNPIMPQIYRKNEDGSFTLMLDQQKYPKTAAVVRHILGSFRGLSLLTPLMAHQLFGSFDLKYDPDFREFLLSNMSTILKEPEYVRLVSTIQRQFSEIKAANSNRALTWDLAVSYVQSNKYPNVNPGNERVAEISGIAGYSTQDFDTLQKIYNHGKQRTFSSIPRIEHTVRKKSGVYTYELLRLDDPLAMAIGTLTDCCQELNNCAELCMEHSMVDKNGRVFVIRDEEGNIVAQSWVWRNKGVLCFDNIEIPDRAFSRATRGNSGVDASEFTDEVFEIYKQASHDLIETDEKTFKKLLEEGKITEEQYDGLRLGKITVGLGFNDIAESLKRNSEMDQGFVARPLPFHPPIELSRGLYTSDSQTQYILEEREDMKEVSGTTLTPYSDEIIEYDDMTFDSSKLRTLEKLEKATKGDKIYLETSFGREDDLEHIVSELAHRYGLNKDATRIVMNPNFAIIFDRSEEQVRIADLFFNTKVNNGRQQMDITQPVIMQIRLALDKIIEGKKLDTSNLDKSQIQMINTALGLTDEIDKERGVGHGK